MLLRWPLEACSRPENCTWVSAVLVQPPNDGPPSSCFQLPLWTCQEGRLPGLTERKPALPGRVSSKNLHS